MKKVIYLGNMTGIAGVLMARHDVQLAAWIAEKEDLSDPVFKAIFEKSGVPFYAVSGHAELLAALKKIGHVELGIIGNFGVILSKEDLKSARRGFINIHLGFLPEYPGRHPIERVLKSGDSVTGVTLHRVTERVDAGPIVEKRATAMPNNRTLAAVFQKLEILSCAILEDNLGGLIG